MNIFDTDTMLREMLYIMNLAIKMLIIKLI